MIRQFLRRSVVVAMAMVALSTVPALAQNFTSTGQSWSGSWGFSSATDRSIALQQAQVLRQVEKGNKDPQTVYNTYNDSRSNYIEATSLKGSVTTDLHVGDEIGENTYAVGSLNTGNTTISVDGNGNVIDSVNSADTRGCVDGSINALTSPSEQQSPYLPIVRSCE